MGPLESFFRQYRWFHYNTAERASAQFRRLRREAGWEKGDKEGDNAWKGYRTALVRQFNRSYAKGGNNLKAWHALLRHIGIVDLPPKVEECRGLIRGKFINIVDLIDARDDPTVVIVHFATEPDLSEYTLKNGKIFPRDHPEAGGMLRHLLRHIDNPDPNRQDPTQTSHEQEEPNHGQGKSRALPTSPQPKPKRRVVGAAKKRKRQNPRKISN